MPVAALLLSTWAAVAPLELDQADRAWIAAHPVVRVAHLAMPPFAFQDAHGALVGLDADYLAIVSERTGLRFEGPLIDAGVGIDGVRAGRFDALMGIGRTPERSEVLAFGQPYAYSPDAIVSPAASPFLLDVRQLAGKRVAVTGPGTHLAKQLGEQAPGARVIPHDTPEDAIVAVARGEVDVAYVDASAAAWIVKQRGLASLRVSGIFTQSADVFIGVRRDWPALLRILDRALASISAAERKAIVDRWMVLDYQSDRRWERSFHTATIVLASLGVLAAVLVAFNRRLRRELAMRRRIQRELEQLRDRLSRANDEKSALMRTVAHDLRTPMTVVLSNAEFLRQTLELDADIDELLGEVTRSVDRMRSLVGVLGDRHAVESGRRPVRRTPIDPGEVLRAAALEAGGVARRKRIEVAASVAERLPAIASDREILRQVLDNLLLNAVKFSPPGARIRAELERAGEALRFTIQDQGPGVPPEHRTSIFAPGWVGPAKPTGGESSTGLGLWIVDRLVRSLGGRVGCGDAPGGGATFWVELPLGGGAAEEPPPPDRPEPRGASAAAP